MTNLEGKVPPIDAVLTTTRYGVGISRLEIRDVREAEVPSALGVTKASYSELRDGSPDEFWEKYMTSIEEAIMRAPATERVAAFLNGEMVGSVLLCHRSFAGDDPEIRLLAVLPAFRGHGIARQLMDECERRVRRLGKARIVLHTTHLMSIARAWSERSVDISEPEAYCRDVANAEIHILDAAHFALDTKADEIAGLIGSVHEDAEMSTTIRGASAGSR